MAVRIPLWNLSTEDRFYVFEVELDGIPYRFRFRWDERCDSWYWSFGTLNEWIIEGERLIADSTPFRRIVSELLPAGSFRTVDFSLEGKDPQAYDPGADFELHFVFEEEIPDSSGSVRVLYVS